MHKRRTFLRESISKGRAKRVKSTPRETASQKENDPEKSQNKYPKRELGPPEKFMCSWKLGFKCIHRSVARALVGAIFAPTTGMAARRLVPLTPVAEGVRIGKMLLVGHMVGRTGWGGELCPLWLPPPVCW